LLATTLRRRRSPRIRPRAPLRPLPLFLRRHDPGQVQGCRCPCCSGLSPGGGAPLAIARTRTPGPLLGEEQIPERRAKSIPEAWAPSSAVRFAAPWGTGGVAPPLPAERPEKEK